jgi:hypothetical protein
MEITGKYDKAILRALCAIQGSLDITVNNEAFDYEPVCTDEGVKILEVNNQTGAQRLVNVGGTTNTTATIIPCGDTVESDPVLICASGTTYTLWVVKDSGVPNGTVYFTDASGAVVPDPSPYTLGKCNEESDPGAHLIESVGAGVYVSPFPANCVAVSWDTGLLSSTDEIIVQLTGTIAGNGQVKVYGNTERRICFDSPVIASVTIPALPYGSVDIEFVAN